MKNDTISIAKAIGIILMLVGHAGCPQALNSFIYQFHMPLFFFFSGYCFKDKYLSDFRSFAAKRIKGIYVPFVKYALLFLVLHNVFFYLNIYNGVYGYNGGVSSLYNWHDVIKRVVKITTSMSYEEQLLGGYWFLRVLFYTSFMGYAFFRLLRKETSQIIGLILLYLSVLLFSLPESLSSFWQTISLSCLATIFFIVGKKLSVYKLATKVWFAMACLGGVLFFSRINPVGMTTREPISLTLYILGALLGILMTKNVSSYVSRVSWLSRLLVYVGNNTLPILTWHFLSFKLVSLLMIKVYGLPINMLACFPVIPELANSSWWLAYAMVGLIGSLGMSAMLNLLGEKVLQFVGKFQVRPS